MIITITPNPALDLTYTIDRVEHGESQRVRAAAVRAGGKGLNVARVARQLGANVTAIAGVGGDTGHSFEAELAASGLPHLLHESDSPTRRTITIVDRSRGETTVLNETGGPFSPVEWARTADAVESFGAEAQCLTGSGSLPPGSPDNLYAGLVELATGLGIPSVIDASGPALLSAARAGATVLKPNRRELAESLDSADPVAGAKHLLSLGACLVFVSLGEDGMIAVSADSPGVVWSARLPQPMRGNPTGAGDAAVAAIAFALADQLSDPADILRRAAACGAAAVLMPQAGEIAAGFRDLEAQLIVERN
ncbi:1-phosphofructokinase family hexose kinase [Homoserinimonas sp. A447]